MSGIRYWLASHSGGTAGDSHPFPFFSLHEAPEKKRSVRFEMTCDKQRLKDGDAAQTLSLCGFPADNGRKTGPDVPCSCNLFKVRRLVISLQCHGNAIPGAQIG